MLHVQQGHAVTFKLASQNLQVPYAAILSTNVIYQNTVLDQVNFARMMCLKLTELHAKSVKHFAMKVLVGRIPISVNCFGDRQGKSQIINVTSKTEKEQDMATVVTIELINRMFPAEMRMCDVVRYFNRILVVHSQSFRVFMTMLKLLC